MPRKAPKMAGTVHLIKLARAGEDGRRWYADAHREMLEVSARLNVSTDRLADLLALFSPRVHIRKSIGFVLYYVEAGRIPPNVVPNVIAQVKHWEATNEIRGPKCRAFARALKGDPDAITLDTWMAVAFQLDVKRDRWEYGYIAREAERRIRGVARVLGWTPAETQAAIWVGIMRESGRHDSRLEILSEIDGADLPI